MNNQTRTVLIDGYKPAPVKTDKGYQPQPTGARTPVPPKPPKATSVIGKPK